MTGKLKSHPQLKADQKRKNNKKGAHTPFLIGRLVAKATRQQGYFRCPCTCRDKSGQRP